MGPPYPFERVLEPPDQLLELGARREEQEPKPFPLREEELPEGLKAFHQSRVYVVPDAHRRLLEHPAE